MARNKSRSESIFCILDHHIRWKWVLCHHRCEVEFGPNSNKLTKQSTKFWNFQLSHQRNRTMTNEKTAGMFPSRMTIELSSLQIELFEREKENEKQRQRGRERIKPHRREHWMHDNKWWTEDKKQLEAISKQSYANHMKSFCYSHSVPLKSENRVALFASFFSCVCCKCDKMFIDYNDRMIEW